MKKTVAFIGVVLAAFVVAATALAVFGTYSLSLSADSAEVEVGKTTKINYTINNLEPKAKNYAAGEGEDQYFSFIESSVSAAYTSSDSGIATVDEDGTVTGVAAGSVTIEVAVTFRETRRYSSCACERCKSWETENAQTLTTLTGEISVDIIPRDDFWIDDLSTYQTGSGTLNVQYPSDYTGAKDGIWDVMDPSVASVDQNGLVTGLKPGETTAQFCLNETGQVMTCQIHVEPLFTLDPTSMDLIDQGAQTVRVIYSSLYTGEQSGTWLSDNEELVTVDAGGTVSAPENASGSAAVRYTDTATGLFGDVSVNVASLFDIDPASLEVRIGSSKKITVSFNPIFNYMEGDINGVWSVGNSSVASVNQDGTVTGRRAGNTVATYSLELNGNTYTATADVTVLCTVYFDPNGGSPTPEPVYVKISKTIGAPADPVRSGYTFLGWYTAADGGEKWDFANDKAAGSMTLYARWEALFRQIDAPAITGPDTIVLYTGYESTDQVYSFSGDELRMYGIDSDHPNTANATLSGAVLTIPEGLTEDGSPYTVTLIASNAGGTARKTITVTVNPIGIVISPESLPDGAEGIPYSNAAVTATGGPSPFTYAVTQGSLPSGLSLASDTGVISGTPDEAGYYDFTVTATDSLGNTGTKSYTITINLPIYLMYQYLNNVDLSLPDCALQASGGMGGPYTYRLAADSAMPGGLILHGDGSITGTPPELGEYYVDVIITDCENNSATATFEIQILDIT